MIPCINYILSCVNRGIRCHSLSFVVIRGDSLSIVAFRVSFVVIVSQFVVFRVSFVVWHICHSRRERVKMFNGFLSILCLNNFPTIKIQDFKFRKFAKFWPFGHLTPIFHHKSNLSKFHLNMFYWSQLRSSWSPHVSSGLIWGCLFYSVNILNFTKIFPYYYVRGTWAVVLKSDPPKKFALDPPNTK